MEQPSAPEGYDRVQDAMRRHWPEPEPDSVDKARVWARLQDSPKSSSRTWFLLPGFAALGMLVAWFALSSRAGETGDVPGMRSLSLVGDAELRATEGSVVKLVQDDASGTMLELHEGTLWAKVDERGPARPFSVRAGDVEVYVVGTTFQVWVGEQRSVRVEVFEGRVRVSDLEGGSDAGTSELLHAPAVWDQETDETLRPPVIDAAAEPRRVPLDASSEPVPTPALDAAVSLTPAPKLSVGPAETYQAAKNLEVAGDYAEAIHAYRKVAQSRDALAEDALYAVGRLQLLRGKDALAIKVFSQYRRKYRKGRYAPAVMVHLLELWQKQGDRPIELRQLAEEFVSRYPEDPRTVRFRKLLE